MMDDDSLLHVSPAAINSGELRGDGSGVSGSAPIVCCTIPVSASDEDCISIFAWIMFSCDGSLDEVAAVFFDEEDFQMRLDRVRDEYVRRDDLDGHLQRFEKQFDDIRGEMRRGSEATEKKLDEIRNLLRAGAHS